MVRTASTYLTRKGRGRSATLRKCSANNQQFRSLSPDAVPCVPLARLDELSGSIIVRNIEPKTMRNSCSSTFPEAERIPTNKVCSFSVGIIQGVEEVWSGRGKEILYVLFKCIDLLTSGIFGNLIENIKYYGLELNPRTTTSEHATILVTFHRLRYTILGSTCAHYLPPSVVTT